MKFEWYAAFGTPGGFGGNENETAYASPRGVIESSLAHSQSCYDAPATSSSDATAAWSLRTAKTPPGA